MGNYTHTSDKRAYYRSQFPVIDYVHEFDIDPEKREIYLFGREDGPYEPMESGEVEEPGVDFLMANRFIRNLRVLQSVSSDPILVHLNSCGGCWTQGMAIYQAIEACPNYVTILNYASARSMSSLIFLAADWRAMLPYSTFMFHRGTAVISGTQTQVDTEYEQNKVALGQMLDIYVKHLRHAETFSERTDKQIRSWLTRQMKQREEVYLTAEQAVEYNFADIVFGAGGEYDWKKLRGGWDK